jgi:hypothetical protein
MLESSLAITTSQQPSSDDRHVDVTRAPAAALGEQHDRQLATLGDLE